MKVLIVLIATFLLFIFTSKIAAGKWNLLFGGNLAMFIMLCFTALGHFKFANGMIMMMPDFIPLKKEIVFISGLAEIVLGLALLFPALRNIAGIVLVLLFLLMLPANINAAVKHINFEKADYSGPGLSYLWFRIPMQLFLILWVWYFSIRK